MLKTRSITLNDLEKIKEINEINFPDIELPDFKKMLGGFIIEDENNNIVMAGGVKLISEALLVTNKDMSRIKVGKALVIAQGACIHISNAFGIKEVYAFTHDEKYTRHLIQHGFYEKEGKTLLMRF